MSFAAVVSARADAAPFDLTGPKLEVKVTRAGKTLPISEVPNLAVGDRVWIKADLPEGQSAHYLMVAAFLRGSTNPPPENWFFRQETWNKKTEDAGLTVTVPEGAQQVLLFLAPETSGDFGRCQRGARQAGIVRARVAGSESGHARPLAAGDLSRRQCARSTRPTRRS